MLEKQRHPSGKALPAACHYGRKLPNSVAKYYKIQHFRGNSSLQRDEKGAIAGF
jgi:hypothetical protein